MTDDTREHQGKEEIFRCRYRGRRVHKVQVMMMVVVTAG
jgi:hypothetical protein